MSSPTNIPRFIPLSTASQGNSENVLYLDSQASPDAIYECANGRLKAVIDLLDELHAYKSISTNSTSAVAIVATYLLSDVYVLFEQLRPSNNAVK